MARNGGDKRGNSRDRHARRVFLLTKHGDGTTCPCWECGATVDYDTLRVDRIQMGKDGGSYRRDNIRPHCPDCSNKQGYETGFGAQRQEVAA